MEGEPVELPRIVEESEVGLPKKRREQRKSVLWDSVKHGANSVRAKTREAAGRARQLTQAKMSVFGSAPSLSVMKDINDLTRGKTIFRGAEFWYRFRQYYFYIFPFMFVFCLIIATTAWNKEQGHMFLGALLSLISCVAVCASYIAILPWRKHPSTIVFYRALTNILFSIIVISSAISMEIDKDASCDGYTGSVEFAIIAGEVWLTTIALDLVASLTNPFTSYKQNMKRYHVITWSVSLLLAFALYNQPACQGRFEGGFCWVNTTGCIIGYYVAWMICMYLYQLGAVIFAFFRLRKGLPVTFEIRSKIAWETFKLLALYCVYVVIISVFFIVISFEPATSDHPVAWHNFRKVYLFLVSARGFVDGVVWFMQHEFASDELTVVVDSHYSHEEEGSDVEAARMGPLRQNSLDSINSSSGENCGRFLAVDIEEHADDASRMASSTSIRRRSVRNRSNSAGSDLSDTTGSGRARKRSSVNAALRVADGIAEAMKELAEVAALDFDDADLSPQVNMALRQQIVKYVTMGVTKAASNQPDVTSRRMGDAPVYSNPISALIGDIDRALNPLEPPLEDIQVTEFLLEGEHPFKAFAQDIFADIRAQEGIDEAVYLQALQQTEREQLSEGASGAFMFFCGGMDFIVKTIRPHEANVLHRSLPALRDYLRENPSSLLVRFLGSYSLKVYAQTFSFVVMRNIFEPGVDVNERYDIKGSWVNRSAAPPMPNKQVVCRHCNEMFTPSARKPCQKIVGTHEANVVLKDNDLRTKISLHRDDVVPLLDIIKKDSDLLADLGVLDYSLIVGVKKRNFEITDNWQADTRRPESMGRKNSRSNSATASTGKGSDGRNKKRYTSFNAKSVSGPAVYYMGIVDFLQDWSSKKKIERAGKIYLYRQEPGGISVMEPDSYCQRFQDKMDVIFDVPDEVDTDEERDSFVCSASDKRPGPAPVEGILGNRKKSPPAPTGSAKVSMRRSSCGNTATVGFHQRGSVTISSYESPLSAGADANMHGEERLAPEGAVRQVRLPFGDPQNSPLPVSRLGSGKVVIFEHMEEDGGTMNAMHVQKQL